jgi:uncharacterized protein
MDRKTPLLSRDFSSLSLEQAAQMLADRSLPPVEQWHPERSGDSHMEITADGRWFHEGGEIKRPAMVQLFSTILRRESDGSYALVTPAERQSIVVHDLPFRAVELKSEGQGKDRKLVFRLNTDELVMAGPDHPLSFGADPDAPDPRLHVRGPLGTGLSARLDRALYYELVDMALADAADAPDAPETSHAPRIWSNGAAFSLGGE